MPRHRANPSSVGSQSLKRSGSKPLMIRNETWTAPTRRCTQRSAPGNSISRRSCQQAFSRLPACPALRTTASTSARVPGRRAARQSGSRLKVLCPSGQYQRAMRVPGGERRSEVPWRANPQPPSGGSGQRARFASCQAFWLTYSSPVRSHSKRSCTGHRPARRLPWRASSRPTVRPLCDRYLPANQPGKRTPIPARTTSPSNGIHRGNSPFQNCR